MRLGAEAADHRNISPVGSRLDAAFGEHAHIGSEEPDIRLQRGMQGSTVMEFPGVSPC